MAHGHTDSHGSYVKAFGPGWLTPLYDHFVGAVFPELEIKHALIKNARIEPGYRVLDVGCGTGTLCIEAKKAHPGASVGGVDGDPKVLQIARRKAQDAGSQLTFDEGMSYALPYGDASFDRVFATLMLHHLTPEDRMTSLREMLRVLSPGGELHVADFGRPHTLMTRVTSWPIRVFDREGRLAEHLDGLLPARLRDAGFEPVTEGADIATLFGTVSLVSAVAPARSG